MGEWSVVPETAPVESEWSVVPEAPQAEGQSFLSRAVRTIKHGVGSVVNVAKDVPSALFRGVSDAARGALHGVGGITERSPEELAATQNINRARAGELARGVDDITSLGYGQKLADKANRAIGRETKEGQQASQAASAELAPDYRTTGSVVALGAPSAAAGIAKATGAAVRPFIRAVTPAGTKALAKVASIPYLGPVLAPLAAGAGGAAEGIVQYEAAVPAISALSAGADGHRLEAAGEAATDPAGLLLSGGLSGGAAYLREPGVTSRAAKTVLESRGAEARKFIEEHGDGAKVGLTTPGSGGVFDAKLKGVSADDRGIGVAAKRGAVEIADTIEEQFARDTGVPYREGPKQVKDSQRAYRDAAGDARAALRDVSATHRQELTDARRSVLVEASQRAKAITEAIEHEHAIETSAPYRKIKERIDSSPAAAETRDVAPIVTAMQDAVNDLETAPFVRSQLNEQLAILERFRDPRTEAVVLPERQLNGLRRTLMRAAKVGMSDAPGEAEAPLRRAAFVAKQMVDDGPYKPLNELYAEGVAKREAARKAVGLKGKPPKDRAADVKQLASTLKRSVDDPTALPGQNDLADMSGARGRLSAVDTAREASVKRVAADLAAATTARDVSVETVAKAAEAAIPDRAALGLNAKIGTRKTDVNQIRLALERQGANSNTGGGNPSDLPKFRAAHPDLGAAIDLPELARARADLAYRLVPHHGGLKSQIAGATLGPAAAIVAAASGHGLKGLAAIPAIVGFQNATPIAGRVLTPLARKYKAAVARLAGAARKASNAANFIRESTEAGLGAQDARKIYNAAHPVH